MKITMFNIKCKVMKISLPRLASVLLLFAFMLGFVNVADAAYAGKKKQATTEAVANDGSEVTMISPAPVTPVAPQADDTTILLVILSFILPPLAVYLLYDEAGTPFIVNLILTLLFWVPGVIHALYHVLK